MFVSAHPGSPVPCASSTLTSVTVNRVSTGHGVSTGTTSLPVSATGALKVRLLFESLLGIGIVTWRNTW